MYSCKIIADSISEIKCRLITLEVCYPRIIHSEMLTHRSFSRNSSSSRALPINKMLEQVKNNPFIPFYWGKNKSGMQAEQELNFEEIELAKKEWLMARTQAVESVEKLQKIGLHKQLANRILEPWSYITVLISATDFDNFLNLRKHKAAQPEIKKIAIMMDTAINNSTPVLRHEGEWHDPFIKSEEIEEINNKFNDKDALRKVGAGRACRVSYLTHLGIRDLQADYDLCKTLLSEQHMSPMEHSSQCMNDQNYYGNFCGWKQYRKFIPGENVYQGDL